MLDTDDPGPIASGAKRRCEVAAVGEQCSVGPSGGHDVRKPARVNDAGSASRQADGEMRHAVALQPLREQHSVGDENDRRFYSHSRHSRASIALSAPRRLGRRSRARVPA